MKSIATNEELGKRLNIEVKKMVKQNKERQVPFNLVNIDMFMESASEGKIKFIETIRIDVCPAYKMEHSGKKELRKV